LRWLHLWCRDYGVDPRNANVSREDLLEYTIVRKLESEGLSRSNRQEFLLEAVLKAVQFLCIGQGAKVTGKQLDDYFSDPDRVHIAKPVEEYKLESSAEMRKAEQEVGEQMLAYAKSQGITLTKRATK